MKYVIGVDVGTSATKTVLFDSRGNIVAQSSISYPLYQPQNGWAEQNADDWFRATVKSIKEVITSSNLRGKDIKGIGVSGQMHGLVLLDKENNLLCNSIIWCDQRTGKECEEIKERFKDRYLSLTSNLPSTAFTLSKLLWIKNNKKDIYSKIDKVLLPKDYINFKLTGKFATDVSDASGTGYFDVAGRDWCKKILDAYNISPNWVPKVYESGDKISNIKKSISKLTCLSESCIVVAGAGDQAASALGNGIISQGDISITLGSSGVVFAPLLSSKVDKKGRVHTFCHAVKGLWHVMGVTQACGLSVKWFKDNFCQNLDSAPFKNIYALLDDKIKNHSPNGRIIYLPYLMGERTPHLDSECRGAFIGLSASHTIFDIYNAVIEGANFSIKDCFEIIAGLGLKSADIKVSGGGAASEIWLKKLSECLNFPMTKSQNQDSGALGVAMLASAACIYNSIEESKDAMIKTDNQTIIPKKENFELYNRKYQIYKKLYSDIKESNNQLALLN